MVSGAIPRKWKMGSGSFFESKVPSQNPPHCKGVAEYAHPENGVRFIFSDRARRRLTRRIVWEWPNMPIQHATWSVDANPQPLVVTCLLSEVFPEQMISNHPGILSGQWVLISQQEHAGFGECMNVWCSGRSQ